ncbi:MAG: DUF5752 family protein [archaeon]
MFKEILIKNVPGHKVFFCNDGSTFNNLEELRKALISMSDETFNYHVNSEKNDFANWIYDVIGDIKLANNLRTVGDKKTMAKKIRTRISYIKKNLTNSSDLETGSL